MPDLEGVNLIAMPAGRRGHQAGDVLLVAHLDTVRCSAGADDNTSGVAVVLEVARQLQEQDHRVVTALDGGVSMVMFVSFGDRVMCEVCGVLSAMASVTCTDSGRGALLREEVVQDRLQQNTGRS